MQIATTIRIALLALATAANASVAIAAAGKVEFVHGAASIVDSAGNAREASKGSQFDEGETLITADGRMQVKFIDGGYISLQPNTSFKVEEYHYNGREDGSERGIFRLVKGGLRAITGVIGHANKPNYRMDTPVATIGIRGTEFTASLDDAQKLLVKVGDGAVFMQNDVGNLVLYRGQAGEVSNAGSRPGYSEVLPVLVAAGPQQGTFQDTLEEKHASDASEKGFANADIRSDQGVPCAMSNCLALNENEIESPTPLLPPLPGGSGDDIAAQVGNAIKENMTGSWSGSNEVNGRLLGFSVPLMAEGKLDVNFGRSEASFSVDISGWMNLVTSRAADGRLNADGSFTFSDGAMTGSACITGCTLTVNQGQLSGEGLGNAGINFSVQDLFKLITLVNRQNLQLQGGLTAP
ncbi:FecR domain-containing protein [Methylobacillus flagellatus]|uniref:FecR family protein n=1 Tax=Methylobacillus flagellatus TaxID=405 RepID=UPI0028541077|nr:FecR domain-containing protein [Methylobacillus flagellatus]MDR5171074.1 FecR domain-containing protein [Methylobacillus flagellatus]